MAVAVLLTHILKKAAATINPKIMDFGAFVSITPNQDGLVHISQISQERVNNVSDVLSEGDVVKVKVLEVDKQGRVKLTMKDIEN